MATKNRAVRIKGSYSIKLDELTAKRLVREWERAEERAGMEVKVGSLLNALIREALSSREAKAAAGDLL